MDVVVLHSASGSLFNLITNGHNPTAGCEVKNHDDAENVHILHSLRITQLRLSPRLRALKYHWHIFYDTWATVSGDLIDTILGENIKTNRSIGHKCRSFIRALLIDFPVGNLTLMKWVGTNVHGPVITLTLSYPQPLRSWWVCGAVGRGKLSLGRSRGKVEVRFLQWRFEESTSRDAINTWIKCVCVCQQSQCCTLTDIILVCFQHGSTSSDVPHCCLGAESNLQQR